MNDRNKRIVGKNSKSYNDKHRNAPIILRPIHDALQKAASNKHKRLLRSLGHVSKPVLLRAIKNLERGFEET